MWLYHIVLNLNFLARSEIEYCGFPKMLYDEPW
jgi:hypothetical protein